MANVKAVDTEDAEKRRKEINQLEEKLMQASRTEAKYLRQRIGELQSEETRVTEQIQEYDDLIAKKLVKIEKISEQYQQLSVKTNMLGQDA